MMIRTVFAAAVFAFGVTAVAAQSDPIAARKALMKTNGDQAKIVGAMLKGDAPFDLTKAKAALASFEEAGEKAPALFPDNSKTGGDTAALPKIWEDKADFDARLAKIAADAKAAQGTVTDLDSFKSAWATIGKQCGGCHELYRAKKS
jgi:cytochrome c556